MNAHPRNAHTKTDDHCAREEAVAAAAAVGPLPEPLATHAAECPVCRDACRDVAQATQWMLALAISADRATAARPESLLDAAPLPDAGIVWRRAALAAAEDRTEKMRTALEYAQLAFAAAGPIGLAGWVVWNWYGIEAAAAQFLLSVWPQLAGAMPAASLTAATFALASLAPAALTLVALALGYPLLASE